MLDYGSVCSGVCAATVAWRPLGWRPAWFSEIAPFPAAVLAHHYPQTSNHGDINCLPELIKSGKVSAPSLLVGGTPCQDFSIIGMRAGLEGGRGALTKRFVETADAIDEVRTSRGDDECVVIWENVAGVLSDKSNAFGCILAALAGEDCALLPSGGKWSDAGCVFGPKRTVAWRVLNAEYFGLAQRRRRVFVVASARDGFDPLQILFEREGVRRDTPPRRGEGDDVAGHAPFGPALQCGCGHLFAEALGAWGCFNCEGDEGPAVSVVAGVPAFGGDNSEPLFRGMSLNAHGVRHDFATETFCIQEIHDMDELGILQVNSKVRRLTEIEYERLQGFPDDYTRIAYRGRSAANCPSGPRYKAIGNSKAVPIMRWLGNRIDEHLNGSIG